MRKLILLLSLFFLCVLKEASAQNYGDLLFNVNGQSSGIKVTNTNTSKAKTKTTFNAGADSKALVMK